MNNEMIDGCREYLEKLRTGSRGKVAATGIDRHTYAGVTARCLAAYNGVNDLRSVTPSSVESTLQSYSRIVCAMAVLAADGDVTAFARYDPVLFADHGGFVALYMKMMTAACDAVGTYAGRDVLNFSVKELMLAYELTKNLADAATLGAWREALSAVGTTSGFYTNADKATNRNVYIMGGEQLRAFNGLADTGSFIDTCWSRQKTHFNACGMYLDNYSSTPEHNPVLYDLTTRVQLQLVTGFGYGGRYLDEMNGVLRRGGLVTLFFQSAAGEMSYGGRSNQFLFNEALIASNCEYEAAYYAGAGDAFTAGVYKRAAHLAIRSIDRWLDAGKHLKNFFTDPKTGTEGYGNYDKYMVTLASFLAIGYCFADDSIAEEPCPAECGGYVVAENENFHIIVANAGGYSLEITTDADKHYDSNGLGRIHRAGVPTELALSMPFTATPKYTADSGAISADLSADVMWFDSCGKPAYLAAQTGMTSALEITEQTRARVAFRLTYTGGSLSGVSGITETYTLTSGGLAVTATLLNPASGGIGYTVPTLVCSGDGSGALCAVPSVSGSTLTVTAGGHAFTVTSDADSAETEREVYANRNGRYRMTCFRSRGDTVTLHFNLR